MTLKVTYFSSGKAYYLTPLITNIEWSGETTVAARRCVITFNNTLEGTKKAVSIRLGKEIRFYKDSNELFRGIIFATDCDSSGAFTVTAYDFNHYLTKNSESMVFTTVKASDVIKQLCKKFGIEHGAIEDTGYVIPKLILRNKTIYDMMTIALTETRKKTGKVFLLSNEKGKLILRERKKQVKRIRIKDGSNLLSASYSESIEDLRNSVRLTGDGGEESKGVTVQSDDSVKKYGLMREKQHEGDKSDSELGTIARELLKELNKVEQESNVEAIGHTSIIAGKSVQVAEKMTGIKGGFYVIADTHYFEPGGSHTMSLRISKTLELNEIEYEDPTEELSSTGDYLTNLDYDAGYIATAYAPSLGGINSSGTGLTASGTKVVEGRTIAVDPNVIPYGSVVAIRVPSLTEYSGLYLAEDTGGAIDGKRIDIAVVADQAMNFGKRAVEVAVLEVGKGRQDARSKAARWSEIEQEYANKSSGSSGSAPTDAGGTFMRPTQGAIKSGFGNRSGGIHYGIDIASAGTVVVVAAATGTVSRSYRSTTYGECIMIKHTINGNTYETVYAHMRDGSRRFSVGEKVERGTIIGIMGNTGDSDGQHLHFEVHRGSWTASKANAVNPLDYF